MCTVGSRGLAGNSSTHLLAISGKANQTGFVLPVALSRGQQKGTHSSWAGAQLETWCGKHWWPPSPLVYLTGSWMAGALGRALTAWSGPREGEGAPGEAVPGGDAAAAGDRKDDIKDDKLFFNLTTSG